MDLYQLSLADRSMNDRQLTNLMLRVPERSIVLLEDVDSAVRGREMQQEGVSFSGLLNVLDGVASRPGILMVQSTNHPEVLDPAQVRDGRADMHEHFGEADADQAARMFLHFYDNAPGSRPARGIVRAPRRGPADGAPAGRAPEAPGGAV